MKLDTVPSHVREAYQQHKAAINKELLLDGEPEDFALMVQHWIAVKAITSEYPDVLLDTQAKALDEGWGL